MKKRKKSYFGKVLYWLVLVGLITVIVLHRQVIFDFAQGLFYQPSERMMEIREKLNLTDRGEFLFSASRPEINNEEEFNENCREDDDGGAVLGCYKQQRIYVYYIDNDELDGILELTTAHELLHAVYERLSDGEKENLKTSLEDVYSKNKAFLEEEIGIYGFDKRLEEIYVRVGTEVRDLPDILKEHYAKIFEDRDKIVSFYDGYIKVFRRLKAEFERLEQEMTDLNKAIDGKIVEYEKKIETLNREVEKFNNCVNTIGCFSSESEYYSVKNKLMSESSMIDVLYGELDALINKYNNNVQKYNENVMKNEELENIINSKVKVEGL